MREDTLFFKQTLTGSVFWNTRTTRVSKHDRVEIKVLLKPCSVKTLSY